MNILLGFAPFLAFAVATSLGHLLVGLVAATVIAAAFVVRDAIGPAHRPKLLETGTLLLFGALTAYVALSGAAMPIPLVRLVVDGGLFVIVALTLLARRPFTMDYAKKTVDPALWQSPRFVRTNMTISAAWAFAFLLIIVADFVLWKGLAPAHLVTALIVAVIYAAIKFTVWYPGRQRDTALR